MNGYYKWTLVAGLLFVGSMGMAREAESPVSEPGNADIASGISAVEAGDYEAGLRLLRSGITRSPGHLGGRTFLAETLERRLGRPDLAGGILVGGLEHGGIGEYAYLRKTVEFLLEYEMHDSIRSTVAGFLYADGIDPLSQSMIAYTLAHSYFLTENYKAALQYFQNFDVWHSVEGNILRARIHWKRGNRAEAFSLLNAELGNASPMAAGQIFKLMVDYRVDEGDLEAAVMTAKLWALRTPSDPFPRIQLLRLLHRQGEKGQALRLARELIDHFSQNEEAMFVLANYAADTGNVKMAAKIHSIANAAEFEMERFTLILSQARIADGAYSDAVESITAP